MDKKIRIVSFQNAHNFGAILQAYGLQETIKSLGYNDVKFINYYPEYLRLRYYPFQIKWLKPQNHSLSHLLGLYFGFPFFFISCLKRYIAFKGSIKRLLNQTDVIISSPDQLEQIQIDILICGSDQIWNTGLTGNFDEVFFASKNYYKYNMAISYAASTELSSLSQNKLETMAGLIQSFNYISVREKPVKEALSKYTNRNIDVCIDPTLLCGSESFDKIASNRLIKDDYILIYAYVPNDPLVNSIIKTIPDYKRFKIHIILLGPKSWRNAFDTNVHSAISIEDFLSYIKYASYVITNSFHGLAFSLLFKKNFNVTYVPGKDTRCHSLLAETHLLNRFVKDIESANWDEVNYIEVDQVLDEIREKSRSYLLKSFKSYEDNSYNC